MPLKDDHIRQAQHNQTFCESFDKTSYSDWASTVLFYIGLHYVDAFLATRNVHPGSHDMRDRLLAQVHELRNISRDYWRLKSFSRTARCNTPPPFQPSDIANLENIHLARIRQELTPHLT
jgi:hypothetical protein